MLMTRDQFEADLRNYKFRNGSQTQFVFRLDLPQEKWMTTTLDLFETRDPKVYRYSDLSEAERAAIWQRAYDGAIRESATVRRNQQAEKAGG